MTLRTPRHASMLWLAGIALAIGVFPVLMYSGHLYYAEGGLSPDGPGMAFVGVLMTAPLWMTLWLLVIAAFLVRYAGAVPLAVGMGRTFPAMVLSLLAFVISAFFLWCALVRVDVRTPSRLPFALYFAGCAVYFQYLRGAAVGRSERGRTATRD